VEAAGKFYVQAVVVRRPDTDLLKDRVSRGENQIREENVEIPRAGVVVLT
jgi:hypothetical protein